VAEGSLHLGGSLGSPRGRRKPELGKTE
jgi:hypothetical protein